jgi:hypothetical protein
MSRDNDGPGFGPPHNGGGGFQGYPVPYPYGGMPVIIRNDRDNRPPEPQEPPVRVQVAAAIMSHLTNKTRTQVAVTEHQVEQIPGQKLTEEEEGTRATALNMLSHWFAGKLEPDIWEKQSLQQTNGVPTLEFRCVCSRQDHSSNPDCPFCEGEGTMEIVVKNPRRVSVDASGKVITNSRQAQTKNALATTGQPAPGGVQGRRPQRPPSPGGPVAE